MTDIYARSDDGGAAQESEDSGVGVFIGFIELYNYGSHQVIRYLEYDNDKI